MSDKCPVTPLKVSVKVSVSVKPDSRNYIFPREQFHYLLLKIWSKEPPTSVLKKLNRSHLEDATRGVWHTPEGRQLRNLQTPGRLCADDKNC